MREGSEGNFTKGKAGGNLLQAAKERKGRAFWAEDHKNISREEKRRATMIWLAIIPNRLIILS